MNAWEYQNLALDFQLFFDIFSRNGILIRRELVLENVLLVIPVILVTFVETLEKKASGLAIQEFF